jgi:iron complex outermembrane recepter protein
MANKGHVTTNCRIRNLPSLLPRVAIRAVGLAFAALLAAPTRAAPPPSPGAGMPDFSQLSIQTLAKIDITSVTKSPEPLGNAPAAIYVITHDEIMRSGARTLPEILRLAPNLDVAQIGASSYAITAHGFNGASNASFSNKLLILIDGRSVYSPLFGGVYWDMQDIPPEDIERIEIISGPASSLWGANAVNGVINIITRDSRDTEGSELIIGGGNLGGGATVQYGGRLTSDLTCRAYLGDFYTAHSETSLGANAGDGWTKPQGGFRLDWDPGADAVTLEGDYYQGWEDQVTGPDATISGGDVVGHWRHRFDDASTLQLLAYYDHVRRLIPDGGGGFVLNTYDLEIQHGFAANSWNSILWGLGDRVSQYDIGNLPELLYVPAGRTLNLANAFIQDSAAVTDRLKLVVGMKLENDPFSGLSPMPSARLAWKVSHDFLLWSAVSRAVRAPTPFDTDIEEKIGSVLFLEGNPDFRPETLTAYQIGLRAEPTRATSVSISTYYDVYDDLRSIELNPDGLILPLVWGNMMEGETYGLEAWGDYSPAPWWRLAAGLSVEHENLRFKPGSSELGGIEIAGDDPSQQGSLRSTIDLGRGVSWEAALRYVGPLPDPAVPGYVEFNTSLNWAVSKRVDFALSGFNLLHDHHVEFAIPPEPNEVGRSAYLETRIRF